MHLVPRRIGRRVPARHSVLPVSRYLDADFDRLFDELARGFGQHTPTAQVAAFQPNVDVSETDTEIIVSAELPGLEEKDFDVNLEANVLTIKGEKRDEREDSDNGYHRVESTHGVFERAFRLPEDVDPEKVRASYEHGVLRVTIAKPEEAKPEARSIPVTTA